MSAEIISDFLVGLGMGAVQLAELGEQERKRKIDEMRRLGADVHAEIERNIEEAEKRTAAWNEPTGLQPSAPLGSPSASVAGHVPVLPVSSPEGAVPPGTGPSSPPAGGAPTPPAPPPPLLHHDPGGAPPPAEPVVIPAEGEGSG